MNYDFFPSMKNNENNSFQNAFLTEEQKVEQQVLEMVSRTYYIMDSFPYSQDYLQLLLNTDMIRTLPDDTKKHIINVLTNNESRRPFIFTNIMTFIYSIQQASSEPLKRVVVDKFVNFIVEVRRQQEAARRRGTPARSHRRRRQG